MFDLIASASRNLSVKNGLIVGKTHPFRSFSIVCNIVRYQTEMTGILEGDGKFMALQAKILTAGTIKAKLTDQGEQAFMEQMRQEWKAEQEHTERGRTLTAIARTYAERARLQQLQQLFPQSSLGGSAGT